VKKDIGFRTKGFEINIDENKYENLVKDTENKITGKLIIRYDDPSSTLYIDDSEILMKYSTNYSTQADLCKVLLKDKSTVDKKWFNDEIFDEWGHNSDDLKDPKAKRMIYDASTRANDKIASTTKSKVTDFFIASMKDVCVNPKYRDNIIFN